MKDKRLRILHALSNPAGQAGILARAQRQQGHQTFSCTSNGNFLNYYVDKNLELNKGASLINQIWKRVIFFLSVFFKYDVFHFHAGTSLLPFRLDLPVLKLFRKKNGNALRWQ